MKLLSASILSVILFVSMSLLPALTSAENVGQSSGTYINSGADSGTPLINTSNTTTGTASRFDPMWLLPLLIVPVAFVIYKAANDDLPSGSFETNTYALAGVKGGKAKKKAEKESDTHKKKHKK